jgi:hypothetical protein
MTLMQQVDVARTVVPATWITGGIGRTPSGGLTIRVLPARVADTAALLEHAGIKNAEIVGMASPRPREQNGARIRSFPELARPIGFDQMFSELGWVCDLGGIDDFDLVLEPSVTAEHERNPRRYAQVTAHDNPPLFEFADQTLRLPWRNRLGLYAHEVGHVLDPDPRKTEPGADATALRRLGIRVGYDKRWPGKGLQVALSGPGVD